MGCKGGGSWSRQEGRLCPRQPGHHRQEATFWGMSWGVERWPPVISAFPGVGTCVFFTLAPAMLKSPESKYFCWKGDQVEKQRTRL